MRHTYKGLVMLCVSLMGPGMQIRSHTPRTQCPTITIDCPIVLVEPNEPFKISVTVTGADPKLSLSYNWTTNAGTIVSGQGTPEMTMRNPKPHCQTTTVTVKVGGLDSSCQNSVSCSMILDLAPVSRKFDEYGEIAFKDEKARLDRFAEQLKKEPGASGYIVFYTGRRANERQSRRRADRDKIYLIDAQGFDGDRIVAVKGGERDELTMELWIAPQGAAAPPYFTVSPPKCP